MMRSRLDTALIAGLIMAIFMMPLCGFGTRCASVRGEVLRLHILANSDSDEDQALKLQVRDAILEECGELFAKAQDLEQAEEITGRHLDQIQRVAETRLGELGCDLPVQVELTRMYFTTRSYENGTLPAGTYDALRVTIGEAKGKNWWCVMFPPLCLPAATKTAPEAEEQKEQITALEETPNYRMAFASVELVEGIIQHFRSGQEP